MEDEKELEDLAEFRGRTRRRPRPRRREHKEDPEKAKIAKIAFEEIRRRQKKTERIVLACVLSFVAILFYIVWYAELVPMVVNNFRTMNARDLRSKSIVLDCAKQINKNLPYCQERQQETKSSWRSIERNGPGKVSAFSLHGKE